MMKRYVMLALILLANVASVAIAQNGYEYPKRDEKVLVSEDELRKAGLTNEEIKALQSGKQLKAKELTPKKWAI